MINIHTGDFWKLSHNIPNESVDLIFTDPDYDNLEDYAYLSEEAVRVLKPGASLLAFYKGRHPAKVLQSLGQHLDYKWTLHYNVTCTVKSASKVFTHITWLYWFARGNTVLPNRYIVDCKRCGGKDALDSIAYHRWSKHPSFVRYYLTAFSQPGDLVLDPFTGGGVVPAICKMTERNFLGYEIDAEAAAVARQRVSKVQLPLFVLDPVQTKFEITQMGN